MTETTTPDCQFCEAQLSTASFISLQSDRYDEARAGLAVGLNQTLHALKAQIAEGQEIDLAKLAATLEYLLNREQKTMNRSLVPFRSGTKAKPKPPTDAEIAAEVADQIVRLTAIHAEFAGITPPPEPEQLTFGT